MVAIELFHAFVSWVARTPTRAILFSLACYALSYYFLGWRGVVALIFICFGLVATA